MELNGDIKKQVEQAGNKEEANEVIAKVDSNMTNDELENVSGGSDPFIFSPANKLHDENTLRTPLPLTQDSPIIV